MSWSSEKVEPLGSILGFTINNFTMSFLNIDADISRPHQSIRFLAPRIRELRDPTEDASATILALQDYAAQCGLFAGLKWINKSPEWACQRMQLRFWGVLFGSGYGAETEDVGINTEVEPVPSHFSHLFKFSVCPLLPLLEKTWALELLSSWLLFYLQVLMSPWAAGWA